MLKQFGMHFEPMVTAGSLGIVATMIGGVIAWWIRTAPDRRRAENEGKVIDNAEVGERLKEFRLEVHALRNELAAMGGELRSAQNESSRRGDRLNMMRFILMMVIDELAAKDPHNKVLAQARNLLSHIEDEPHRLDSSDALSAAEETVEKARETVQQVKAEEAKGK